MADSIHVFDPGFQVLDPATGNPSSGAKILFFDAGTSTPRTVYSDSGLTTSLGTSITCNSNGVPVNGSNAEVEIYTGNTAFKIEIQTSASVTLYGPIDNVQAALDTSAFAAAGSTQTYNRPIDSEAADHTIVAGDAGKVMPVSPSGGTFTMTLPNAVTVGDGFTVTLRHTGNANQVRIAPVSAQTIDVQGKINVSAYVLTGIGHSVELTSDGANWIITSETAPFGTDRFTIVDRLSTPPGSPTPGARYIVTSSPTGDWSSFSEHDIAEADGQGGWVNYDPPTDAGWLAYVQDEDEYYAYKGSAWESQAGFAIKTDVTYDFISSATASGDASIDFTGLTSTYFMYELIVDNITPSTDATLYLRTSTDGGSTYDNTAGDYQWVYGTAFSGGSSQGASGSDTEIEIAGVGSAANENGFGRIRIYNPSDSSNYTQVEWQIAADNGSGLLVIYNGAGSRRATADVDAFQLLFNTGNVASGNFRLYGIRGS